ncbi:hypothetical protein FK178_08975 [Antarcticibacterium arcticum]|uniref:Peptidase M56 domain-containing protein n=1 Tax=Antarcticibacterium arcticum TaxID=2585771 RepID=A0A5B8YNK9_9FLAO|nr:M56 family metallopeptidase [Antarcticibacterium arcticum]QED37846.1 hypothetical protein FK178_08975 [Antarcticibacterium arcticum]
MEVFLVYILKSAGILTIFYMAYFLLLRNDTSFKVNRKFLLGGICGSFILPLVYFTKKVVVEVSAPGPEVSHTEFLITAAEQEINWWFISGVIYFLVSGILLLRFMLQLFRIISLVNSLPKQNSDKFKMLHSKAETSPFSFFNYIIYNPKIHTPQELELILKHEMVHAGQGHTFDLLLGNLLTCFLWFNPLAWFYKKSIIQNLEFIADRETVDAVSSKKEYLHTLVKVSFGDLQPALSNSFYKSFIKKRILMLNNNKTSTENLWKISLVFPALLAFMLVFNVQTKVYSQEKTTILTTVMEVFIDIDKNTTREDLEGYINLMAEYDVILKFNDIKYNEEGLLTNIKVEFIDKSNVSSGSVTKSNTGGIESFRYVYNKEEGSRFTSPKAHAPVKSNTVNVKKTVFKTSPEDSTKISFDIKNEGSEPVYILNGKVLKNASTIKAIDPNNISGINVLKGPSAVSLYGDAAKDGAIIITTKKSGDTIQSSGFTYSTSNRVMPDSIKYNPTYTLHSVEFSDDSNRGRTRVFRAGEEVFFPERVNTEVGRRVVITNNKSYYVDTPLVVVDGEEKPADFNMTSLDNSQIKNISVLKREMAVKKYGEKAKGGVIEITLKNKKK